MKPLGDQEKKKILIASHESDEISLIESRLMARGYEVQAAESSIEVVQKVNRSHFDLILLDSKMEEVRHTELAALLRKRSVLRAVPIIMIADRNNIASLISSVERGFDDFYIRPIDPLSLQLRVALNIRRAEERLETNPLTQLPGNASIEKTIRHLMDRGAIFSVIYADLNYFKALNDYLGYKKGDDVLKQTVHILETNAKHFVGRIDSFVGHVGGDDFILIVCPTVAADLAKSIIRDFDRIIQSYYPIEVKEQGYIEVKNRKGVDEKFPLASIALAEISNEYIPFQTSSEIASRLSEVKKYLKAQTGSYYLKDRRGQPFISLDEAETALQPLQKEAAEPLGQMLLKAGLINEANLEKALTMHFKTGQHLGQVLASMKIIPPQEIGRMLEKKLGIPYVPLSFFEPKDDMLELFSGNFISSRQVVPLEYKKNKKNKDMLYLGMIDPLNQEIIQEVGEITKSDIKSCLVLEDEFEDYVSRFYK